MEIISLARQRIANVKCKVTYIIIIRTRYAEYNRKINHFRTQTGYRYKIHSRVHDARDIKFQGRHITG